MTFDDLKLAIAVRRLSEHVRDAMTREEQLNFASRVQREYCILSGDTLFTFSVDKVIHIAIQLRKHKSTRIKADVAEQHGTTCFWVGREKGPCSEEVECGHLIPASRGGDLSIANCIIECRAHNNERSDMLIEEYLKVTR